VSFKINHSLNKTGVISIKNVSHPSTSQTKFKTLREVHTCGACGRKGHNRKSCHVSSSSQVVEENTYEDMSLDEDLNVVDTVIYYKLMLIIVIDDKLIEFFCGKIN
jgi:hypothetical protein